MYRMAALELNCNTTGKMIALLSGLQVPLNININESYLEHKEMQGRINSGQSGECSTDISLQGEEFLEISKSVKCL